jgi:TetR/AcrR family transcriptional repressor of bet genes
MTDASSPPQKRPRKERKDNADKRRRQLLDAALESVAKNGLARTTLATVSAEAGLSQGVAVFYFKSKGGLLVEALRAKYQQYQASWSTALDQAGPDPMERLIAMIRADFSDELCNADALATWFAFWGEQRFTPQYAEIAETFDNARREALVDVCTRLIGADRAAEDPELPERMGLWIDTFTDGMWQKLHLNPRTMTPVTALDLTLEFIADVVAPHQGQGSTD